jgi:MFS family permease
MLSWRPSVIKIQPSFIAPLASIMTLVLGSGFYTTYTTLHLQEMGIQEWMIGCISCTYFCGLLISAFCSQHFILRVGHIRAFVTFASVIAVVTLLQGIYPSPSLWILLRFLSGYGLAGICVVVESWLMESAEEADRGTVLSIYMIAYYGAQACSQMFLNFQFATALLPYCLITILSSLSVLPVCMTRFQAPCPENPSILPFNYLYKRIPLGLIGCVIAGMILAPLYTLLPLYLKLNAKTRPEIGHIMMALIVGGTLLQYPIGKLSDRLDRRYVLIGVSIVAIIGSLLFIPDYYSNSWLIFLSFCLGGATFTIYPLSISYTIDHVKRSDMVSAIATLLLAYGLGSSLGPLLAPLLMKVVGPNGLCIYLLLMCLVLFTYTFYKIRTQVPMLYEAHVDFVSLPRTTPNATPIDPPPLPDVPPVPETQSWQ